MSGYAESITRAEAAALIGESVSSQVFQSVSEESAVMMLGTQLPDIPKSVERLPIMDSLPEAYWLNPTDDGLTETTDVKWANKFLTAEGLGCVIVVPQAVFDDSDINIWGALRPKVVAACAKKIDATCYHGSGAPSSFPQALVPGAIAAGNVVDYSDAVAASKDVYDMILGEDGVLSFVEDDGLMVDGHVAAVKMKSRLRGLRGTDGHPVFNSDPTQKGRYTLDGETLVFPRNGALNAASALMISGNWKELVWAKRTQIKIEVERTGVISNSSGVVTHNLKQQRKVALYVYMDFGWQLPNPPNDMQSDPIATSGLLRYPFAVLKP